ncbi:MAG: hypothetical protein LIO93_03725 [Bacteroidales bacterium]|nr:hypothetical protein [Bacteroidales bacterium]
MKASNYLSGLTFGLLVGGIVGYRFAMDPRNRVKVRRFLNDAEDKVREMGDKVKCACGCQSDDLTDQEIFEIEAVLATEAIADAEAQAQAEALEEEVKNASNK